MGNIIFDCIVNLTFLILKYATINKLISACVDSQCFLFIIFIIFKKWHTVTVIMQACFYCMLCLNDQYLMISLIFKQKKELHHRKIVADELCIV